MTYLKLCLLFCNFLRECWFIYPYCENGDLYDAIKRGKNEKDEKKKTKKININNQATRVKILLQIALAIENIHTKVPKVRYLLPFSIKSLPFDKYDSPIPDLFMQNRIFFIDYITFF
jgi:hypothetical protein